MKKVLLIGSGAREHALAEALTKHGEAEVYAVMSSNNPGVKGLAKETIIIPDLDVNKILEFAKQHVVDFAVIGPEKPLADGAVDLLQAHTIPCVGPDKQLAQIETSKSFARELMKRFGIQGLPKFKVFTSVQGIEEFLKELNNKAVIKADGLRAGKGVKVFGEHLHTTEEALQYAKECIEMDGKVVIEEKLEGEEFSVISLVDGESVVDLLPVQDHKRAYGGDKGPNTGGMGSYSSRDFVLPFLSREDLGMANIIIMKTIKALQLQTGKLYKGIFYGGFMLTAGGVKVIEFNARFGDPEALNILPLMTTSFVKVCQAIIEGNLKDLIIEFDNKASVCKYLVPQGYPTNPIKNEKITPPKLIDQNVRLYYAAVDKREDGLYLTGSRAVAVVGFGSGFHEAESSAEKVCREFEGPLFHREDIGTAQLLQKRVQHVNNLEKL